MPFQNIEVARPDTATAPLLRSLGATRVLRLAQFCDYNVDWVEFGAGHVTELHCHDGVEHHFVASGSLRALQSGRSDRFESGDYFFWDGRTPHTSYAEAPGAATMLMVRKGGDPERSAEYRECRAGAHSSIARVDDGFRCVLVRPAGDEPLETSAAAFLLLCGGTGNVRLDGRSFGIGGGSPVLLCTNAARSLVSVEADAPVAFMEVAP